MMRSSSSRALSSIEPDFRLLFLCLKGVSDRSQNVFPGFYLRGVDLLLAGLLSDRQLLPGDVVRCALWNFAEWLLRLDTLVIYRFGKTLTNCPIVGVLYTARTAWCQSRSSLTMVYPRSGAGN